MTEDELHAHYQREARIANTIGLSVPVSVEVQQLVELRCINSGLEKLLETLTRIEKLLSSPPVVVTQPASAKPLLSSTSTKKDSRP